MNKIQSYYTSDKFQPYLPYDVSQRHFRLRTEDGLWIKIPKRIKTKEDLVEQILKFNGEIIYIGTATWLNPTRLGPKTQYRSIADRTLLNHRVVFDIDAEALTLDHLDHCRQTTIKLLDYMSSKERYELEFITFTGLKGFGLSYHDHQLTLPLDPRKRISYIEKERREFINSMPEELKIDDCVYDITRVTKLPGSLHHTGLVCTRLTRADLSQNIEKLLNSIYCINKWPVRLYKPMIAHRRAKDKVGKERTGLISTNNLYLAHYISNKVAGVKKRFIPFFVYYPAQNYEKHLRFVQREYSLGPIYIFDLDNKIYAISLRSFHPERLNKILNRSLSVTRWEFAKFHRLYMRIGQLRFRTGLEGKPPRYIKTLDGEIKEYRSFPHMEFLKTFNINIPDGNFHGSKKLYISQCLKKYKIR